ncbi:uncharacterized protein LOC117120110 [Anneissia japonica]|uniref:uncharacterized protein LOC117120110 n=1 Tax=Anneissia japonica TaxID=1529436 RepID=UPI001425681E|nr:uncharacterized protein LOC117120110 [Anneissia japonica]
MLIKYKALLVKCVCLNALLFSCNCTTLKTVMLNASNGTVCTTNLVTSKEMFELNASKTLTTVLLSVASLLTFLTFCMFLESFSYMTSKVPFGARRGYLAWLIGIYPVFSATSLAGIFIPRASILANWCANVHILCILKCISGSFTHDSKPVINNNNNNDDDQKEEDDNDEDGDDKNGIDDDDDDDDNYDESYTPWDSIQNKITGDQSITNGYNELDGN